MEIIQTYYKGIRFRSRLEARVAVLLDGLGAKWEYEPEGYDLGGGLHYLPDFRVECWGYRMLQSDLDPYERELFIEVKGIMGREDARKIHGLQLDNGKRVLIIDSILRMDGCIWDQCTQEMGNGIASYCFRHIDYDEYAAFPMVSEDGKFFLAGADYDYEKVMDWRRTEMAYKRAANERFGWY